jgi:type III secretory pathway component EscR
VQTLESRIRTDVNVQQVPSQFNLPNVWGIRFWNPMFPTVPQMNVQTNQPEIVAAQAESIKKAVSRRNELWRGLVERSTTLKRALSTRFGVPF